jgi:hypothetical protein
MRKSQLGGCGLQLRGEIHSSGKSVLIQAIARLDESRHRDRKDDGEIVNYVEGEDLQDPLLTIRGDPIGRP